ncbi:winged helix DNA-binding domain-containing protein [Haloprofundus salinisoli]|uniref:winged helix DNA-binding domain-containing protein n=1 Tax=Haloprofundus salinisoli TaxID=2876193 RepID=UPI001CCD5316|nr:winged helix DNA-binding domain-containing protein [Haloprofundus salinisoli]
MTLKPREDSAKELTVPLELTPTDAARYRLRSQRLTPRTDDESSPSELLSSVCGVQAQEKRAAALGVRARSRTLTEADLERALYEDRSVVRTWCMRGTLHLVATADLPLLLSLFGETFASRGPEPKRLEAMGLGDTDIDRAMEQIRTALGEDGPLTREELATRLQRGGVDVDPSSQAPYFLVRRAALLGIACEVAPKEGQMAYDLLDEWVSVDESPDRQTALVDLARRYLRAFQPASVDDFAAWSGLYVRDVKLAWGLVADETTEVVVDGRDAAMLTEDLEAYESAMESRAESTVEAADRVRLLPGYDSLLLGYEKEARPIPRGYESQVWPGSGIIRPTLVADGEVTGTWRLDRARATTAVVVDPFERLAPELEAPLRDEVEAIGEFFDTDVELRFAD